MSGQLGPLQFMLDGVGVDTDVSFESGNAGPFDIGLGFKPPTGAGLAIEGGGFTGGGFLIFDRRKASTRAASSWSSKERLQSPRWASSAPDCRKSRLLAADLIIAQHPAHPLPFGFMLRGVGGLLALNRTVDRDALRPASRQIARQHLFPKDVVANAPRILGDCSACSRRGRGRS